MSTVTTHTDGTPYKSNLAGDPIIAVKRISFADNPATAADVIQCVNVPAKFLVTEVKTIVEVAEGATATATVGNASGANSWDASINLNAAAGTVTTSTPGTDTYATTGKFYTSADTIDITLGHTMDTAVFIMLVYGVYVPEYAV